MRPEPLQSIYQQYKHDTEIVASWLASTAKAFGCTSQTQKPSTSMILTKPTGRLKGKERKKAKAALTPSHDHPEYPEPSKPKYRLAIKDFVPLAANIVTASRNTELTVPPSFSIALERVIRVRKQFAERLESVDRHFDSESDARHCFFVNILEKVRTTLEPLLSDDTSKFTRMKDAMNKMVIEEGQKPHSSLFDVLHVYEPSAESQAAPDVDVSPPAPLDYTIDAEDTSQHEAMFAMAALMKDLSRLRLEISELWKKYEAGEMDIAAVSVATNTAIELARGFEDDISPFVQYNGGVTDYQYKYFCATSRTMGVDPEAKQEPTDDYNFAAYDVADSLFTNTLFNILDLMCENSLGSPTYSIGPGPREWYDEDSVQIRESPRQEYSRIKLALRELLTDLQLLFHYSSPIEDQLLHAMTTTLRTAELEQKSTPDVPVWFSFAAQVYLDTLSVVKIGKGWNDMQREILKFKQSVGHLPISCPERKAVLRAVGLWDHGADPIALSRQSVGEPYKEYTFLRRHSMHCGLWIHVLRTVFHQQGMRHAEYPGTAMCTAQLYHALQQERCLSHDWKDLDTLRTMQGNSAFFVGKPPTSFEGYCNNFCLSIGVSIRNWAPNKRDKKFKVSKDNRPLMSWKGPVSTFVANRFKVFHDRCPISVEEVEAWIQKGSRNSKDINSGTLPTPTTRNTSKNQPLLHRLAAAVTEEIADLDFDYFAIHELCREFLVRLQTEREKDIHPELSKFFMSLEKDNLGYVAGFVFLTVVENNIIMGSNVSTMRLWELAATTMNQWLSEGKGNTITGTATAESK
ncbi:MAG: hypothetical protein Q9168_006039 [Polycauliona sp. 1 TL-2023]